MRVVDSSIPTAETSGAVSPTHVLLASNETLAFASWASQSNASLETGVPASFAARSGGTYAYAAYRYTDGTSKLQVVALATAGNWALNGGGQINSNSVLVMRNGVFTDSGNATWLYTAAASGSAIQVKRQQINSITANPPAISLSNFGPTFGEVLNDSATVVRRVEAVCPTDNGVIVAVGTHRFDTGYSTVQFYWISDNTHVYTLNTILQMPLTETYTTWYAAAKYATFISAIYNPTTAAIWVVANAHASGRPVAFSLQSGIESMVRDVLSIDPTFGAVTFTPASLSLVGSLYYLCGRYTYINTDGSTVAYDCYLTSADGVLWSFGERSFYIQAGASYGALLVDTAVTPQLLYYGGNLIVSRATMTPAQGYASAGVNQLDVSNDVIVPGLLHNQATNNANKLFFDLRNATGIYTDNALLARGTLIYYSSGQSGTNSSIGVFSLDSPATGITEAGRTVARITARDLGSKQLTRHNLLADVDFWSQDVLSTTLSTGVGLIVKTRTKDVLELTTTLTATPDVTLYDVMLDSLNGLRSKALNNPMVAYADVAQAPDVLLKATVTFPDTGSLYALPSFSFLFNASDSGAFSGVAIPKANSWPASGKTKPRVIYGQLAPFNTTTNTGGFNFESRYQGWWSSNNYNAGDPVLKYLQAALESPSHYTTETAFTQSAGAVKDYACLVHGGRVLLYHKTHDYAAATAASNAGYTLITDYQYGNDVYMAPAGKLRPGLAVNTDAWSDKTAYAHSAYQDQEVSLSSADASTPNREDQAYRYTGSALPALVTQWDSDSGPTMQAYNGASKSTVDLRNYFRVGQRLRTNGAATNSYRNIVSITQDGANWNRMAFDANNPALGVGSCANYIRSGDYWAQASSASGSVAATGAPGGVIWVDPKPVKTIELLSGFGAVITNDQTAYDQGWWDSDGTTHYRLDKGWDATNPTAQPNAWKFVNHHGVIGKWRASVDKGLQTSGFMMNEQEIMRYAETQITLWRENLSSSAYANTQWLTYIPMYYAVPLADGAPGTTVSNNVIGGTDDLSVITNAAGLLFELTGRSAGGATSTVPNVYVTGKGGGGGGRGYVTIDTPLVAAVLATDLVIVSGRAQFGTKKVTHPSDSAQCLYPVPTGTSAAVQSFVTVSRFDVFSGRTRTLEDAINYFCNLAGVRSTTYRNYMTGASSTAAYSLTLTTTPQALPLIANISNFVLIATVHIDSTAWLQIDFRTADGSNPYYRLALKQTATGKVTVGLQATGSSITAGGLNTYKWLEYLERPISPIDFCPTAADTVALRISVRDNLINVDINRMPVMDFNLDTYVHTDGTSYKNTTAYSVKVSYSATVTGNTGFFRVPELMQEQKNVVVSLGSNTAGTIRNLCTRNYVRSRPTQSGSLNFAQFLTRDSGITLTKGVKEHDRASDDSHPIGQIVVTGQNSGAFIDRTYVAAEGFSFAVANNASALTVQDATTDAQLRVRESLEFAPQDVINGVARIALEPEDTVVVVYAPPGDAPQQASKVVVVTSVDWSQGPEILYAKYTLRDYRVWT